VTASVLQSELDSIMVKDPQSIDNKFNEWARLYTAFGCTLTAAMKKTQLTKIMPSLYLGCINMANQMAQSKATARVFKNSICSNAVG
jgi:hypothetical protein